MMSLYRLTPNPSIIERMEDSANISTDPDNIDYQAYLAWLAAGNTPQPYKPPVVDPKEQAKAELDATDKSMARIAEDLIAALIAKGLIAEADLPQSARDKLAKRSELRSKLA